MADTQQWFSDCYRRNLVDMHIEDWNPEFLRDFSPELYVENLKKAHIQAPMIYLQSHVGHCYWPTKTGHMHAAFRGREDQTRRLIHLCREAGMHPTGYYSLIFNNDEEELHPDWRMQITEDGQSEHQQGGRYGRCCPNNPQYREFVMAQIDEMAEYFKEDGKFMLDGMFFDMTFWRGFCHCPYCREQYREKTGRDSYPAEDWHDPDWVALMELREKQIGDFAHFVTDYAKSRMPGISVEHNYANGAYDDSRNSGTTEQISEACDYTGGDLYGSLYNHSFTAKYYYAVSRNQPFEYMTCRCDSSLLAHTITKKEETLAVEVLLTAAHHGASFIIDAIDPVGTMDSRVYEQIGRVFERQIPYEPYFRGKLLCDAGVYYSTTSRYNSRPEYDYNNHNCSIRVSQTLIEAHIPFGIVSNVTTNALDGMKVILAPAIAGLAEQNRRDLIEFVRQGGLLYFSGVEDMPLIRELLGAEFDGYTPEGAVYLAPTEAGQPFFGDFTPKYPMPTDISLPRLKGGDYEVLAVMNLPYTKKAERRFAAIHSNPPGVLTAIPTIVTRAVGKGRVIWSAAPIEHDLRRAKKELLVKLLSGYTDGFTVTTTAPRQVELVSFTGEDELLLSTVDLLCTDELLPIRPFTVTVRSQRAPKAVIRLGGRDREDLKLPFTFEDGTITFRVEELVMFEMYRIVF